MEAGTQPLQPSEVHRFRKAIFDAVFNLPTYDRLGLLVQQEARLRVRQLLFPEFPSVSVLSFAEVSAFSYDDPIVIDWS
jgi:flagellar biosynthesis component FlhA